MRTDLPRQPLRYFRKDGFLVYPGSIFVDVQLMRSQLPSALLRTNSKGDMVPHISLANMHPPPKSLCVHRVLSPVAHSRCCVTGRKPPATIHPDDASRSSHHVHQLVTRAEHDEPVACLMS